VKLLPRDPETLGGGNNRNLQLVERIADQAAGVGRFFISVPLLS
jgi:hypothetical protein